MSDSTSTASALTHEDVELYFDEYTEASLAPGLRAQVETHLAQCQACATLYQDLAATADALGSLKAAAPTTIGAAIEASIHTRSAGRFFAKQRESALGQWVFGGPGLVIALVLLLAILVFFYWLSASPTGTLSPPPGRAPAIPAERIVPN